MASSFLGTYPLLLGYFLENNTSRELGGMTFSMESSISELIPLSPEKAGLLTQKSSVGGSHLSSLEKLHFY